MEWMKVSPYSQSASYKAQPFSCNGCEKMGPALLAIAGIGILFLMASSLYTVDGERLVLRDPSQSLGTIQILSDLLCSIAGIR